MQLMLRSTTNFYNEEKDIDDNYNSLLYGY